MAAHARVPVALLAAALVLGLYLRIDAARHDSLSQWDEAYHALVAKHLTARPLEPTLYRTPLEGREHDPRNWTESRVWLHKPPLALWLMAGSIALLGDDETVVRLPSVILGTLSILLTFLLGRELLGAHGGLSPRLALEAGAVAALLHAVSRLHIRLVSGTVPVDHVDLAAAFFVELTVLLLAVAARRESLGLALLGGASLGLAYLTKSMPTLVALAAALPLFLGTERGGRRRALRLLGAVLAALAVALPWQVYCATRWPQEYAWEARYTFRHLFEALEGHARPAWWYVELIPRHYDGVRPLAYVLVLGATLAGAVLAWRRRDRGLAAALVWALLPYVVFSLARTKVYSYVGTAVPAVLLLVGFAAVELRARLAGRRLAAAAVAAVVALQVVAGAVRAVRADHDVAAWNRVYDYPAFRAAMKEIGATRPGRRTILFNVGDGKAIQAMYYTGGTAYPEVPSPDLVRRLVGRGYAVYLVVDAFGTNTERLRDIERAGALAGVTVIRVPPPKALPASHPFGI